MAIITISRQVAALGDEIAHSLAQKLNYKFEDRKIIEARIVELGFPPDKLKKYDERKPGFLASLAKIRDEYFNYLQTAILEFASKNNVILIGRGSHVILEGIPNHISVRFVADMETRKQRLKDEFNWDDKQATARIEESDTNRLGFHKSFFNINNTDAAEYYMTFNTARLSIDNCIEQIELLKNTLITKEKEEEGSKLVAKLSKAQNLVNQLVFNYQLNINFLRAEVKGDTIILHGVSDSSALAKKAVALATQIMTGCKIESSISVVQDFKAFP